MSAFKDPQAARNRHNITACRDLARITTKTRDDFMRFARMMEDMADYVDSLESAYIRERTERLLNDQRINEAFIKEAAE